MLSSSSPATVQVEKATSHLLITPDWTMNMEICDAINSNQWQAKDVIKSVKKRLQHKNPRVHFLALTLLETMIKNCGEFVHFQVVEREILLEMVKIVRKKTDMQVRDKILVLLDSWQEAFGGPQGKYPQYYLAYAELRRSGVHFPPRVGDAAPIFTPPIAHPTPRNPPPGYGMPSNSSVRLDEAMASEMGNLSLSDLDAIQRVMELLDDMLQAVNPDGRDAVKDEVIVDLVAQCRSHQKKIMNLVSSTGDEELLARGLELNDDLQYLITKHDAIASGSPLPIKAFKSIQSSDIQSAPAIQTAELEDEEEDDGFAELAQRNSRNKQVHSQNSSTDSCEPDVSSSKSDMTLATTSTIATEGSSSNQSSALVLADNPAPVSTTPKDRDQDMIDLLSITLSTNPSPPQTPVAHSSNSTTESSVPVAPKTQEHSYNPQQVQANQGYTNYNYAAPWAQQPPPQPVWQPQPQYQQFSSSYPPPPWATPASSYTHGFPSTAYQQFTPYNSTATGPASSVPRPMQHQSSFGTTTNSRVSGVAQQNANVRQTGSPTANKPYVPPYRLFEDLIDLKTGGDKGKNSTGLSSSSNQSMNINRK